MKIEKGELITLDNNKEYLCFSTLSNEGVDYIYLMSNFKPLEIKFAKQQEVNGQIEVTIINQQEEKQKVLKLFQDRENKQQWFAKLFKCAIIIKNFIFMALIKK